MKKLIPSLLGLAVAGFVAAADWPQWRGPNRDDVSKETGLLQTWPKDGPKLLWTFRDAGVGYSAPAIVGDTFYCMGADDKNDNIYALDMNTQAKKWSTAIGPRITLDRGDGPRGGPTVDGDLVYGMSSRGDLICVKATSGDKVWEKELKGKDIGGEMMSGWGYSESPIVDGGLVVCTPGGKNGTMAAFDKKTGDLAWRSKDWTDKAAYSSIVAADIGGVHQFIQLTADTLAGVDPKDGKVLWTYKRHGNTAVIPTPVVSDNTIFITSGYSAGCSLVEITGDAKAGFQAKEVVKNNNMTNHHGGVVLVGDFLYGYDDNKGLECLKFKTTDIVWNQKGEHGKMSVTCADGQLYLYGEKDGAVSLVEASPTGYKENGSFKIPEQTKGPRPKGSAIWTHPVVANGRLYLRDHELIFCYDVKSPGR